MRAKRQSKRPYYKERTQIKDGLWLFKRGDTKSETWHYEISIKAPFKRFKRASTKTTVWQEAVRIAELEWARVTVLLQEGRGEQLFGKLFSVVAQEYQTHIERQNALKLASDSAVHNAKYTLPHWIRYLDGLTLTDLTQDKIDGYAQWRRTQNVAIQDATIRMETALYRHVMEYAIKQKYISTDFAVMPVPQGKRGITRRRDGFTNQQLKTLLDYMEGEYQQEYNNNPVILRSKRQLTNLVRFLAGTGMRVDEARSLTWKDIRMPDARGRYCIVMPSRSKTSTPGNVPAPAIGLPLAVVALNDQRTLYDTTNDDDPVFRGRDGGELGNPGSTFKKVLEAVGLDKVKDAPDRSLTSCRHYYATDRLEAGVPHALVAQTMRTSITQIEKHYGHVDVIRNVDTITQTPSDPAILKTLEQDNSIKEAAAATGQAPEEVAAFVKRFVDDLLE